MQVYHPLNPIYDKDSQVLILGSMPSITSRNEGFYYANKNNRFWKVIEIIFNVNLNTNSEKENFLLKNNIALWDVFASCQIKGSSDSSIIDGKLNDIETLIKNSNIQVIFCTGKVAFNTLTKNFRTNIPILYLPSPSSANAGTKIETLVTEYSKILNYLKK